MLLEIPAFRSPLSMILYAASESLKQTKLETRFVKEPHRFKDYAEEVVKTIK